MGLDSLGIKVVRLCSHFDCMIGSAEFGLQATDRKRHTAKAAEHMQSDDTRQTSYYWTSSSGKEDGCTSHMCVQNRAR
jgi:hypothetical protein